MPAVSRIELNESPHYYVHFRAKHHELFSARTAHYETMNPWTSLFPRRTPPSQARNACVTLHGPDDVSEMIDGNLMTNAEQPRASIHNMGQLVTFQKVGSRLSVTPSKGLFRSTHIHGPSLVIMGLAATVIKIRLCQMTLV